MKVSRNQIIFIISLSIILVGSVVAYFLTRTKDSYQHSSNTLFSSQMLAKNKLEIQKFKDFKERQSLFIEKRTIKLLGGPMEEAELEREKRKLNQAKADKEQKKMLEAVGDASKELGKNILKDIYNIAKCDLVDKGGDKCVSNDVMINLAKDIGVGLLKVGLACAGLGFLGGALDSLFGGGASGPPPIDYEKIRGIISDELKKQHLAAFCQTMNATNSNIQDFISNYMGAKQNKTQSACMYESQTEIGKFMRQPNSLNPEIKYDPNTILIVGTTEGKSKRKYLNDLIDDSSLNDLIKNKSLNGVNSLILVANTDLKAAVELYPVFLSLISYTIIYYQEKATIDISSIGADGNVDNPWISSYIGQSDDIGRRQVGFSLLASLQDLCIKFFQYLRDIFTKFISKIIHKDESSSGCDDHIVWHKCERWGSSYDESGLIPDSFIAQWNKVYPTQPPQMSKSFLVGTGDDRWNPVHTLDNQKYFCWQLQEYMNKPFEALAVMKEMAGIEWLENEKTYNYGLGTHSETNPIIYRKDGGRPFGTNRASYEYSIYHYKYKVIPSESHNKYITSSLHSPIYFGEKKCITCNGRESCVNIINKDINNNTPGNKKLTSDIYCPSGAGFQSALDIDKSPGNLNGNVSPDSRSLYCVNEENISYPRNASEFSCDSDLAFCGSAETPVPKLPFKSDSQNFKVNFFFYNISGKLRGNARTPTGLQTREFEIYECKYANKKAYDISSLFKNTLEVLNLKNDYSHVNNVIMDAHILNNIPPNPGISNNTTRPPINTTCDIFGYEDNMSILETKWDWNSLTVTTLIRGEKI